MPAAALYCEAAVDEPVAVTSEIAVGRFGAQAQHEKNSYSCLCLLRCDVQPGEIPHGFAHRPSDTLGK